MKIESCSLTFGYHSPVKTLYQKGLLPSVKYGFYGEKLTKKNCTIEHLKCVCEGGKTELDNVVLATDKKNNDRGNKPLDKVFNWYFANRYLSQFIDVNVRGFNGNKYIEGILNTLKELLGNIPI